MDTDKVRDVRGLKRHKLEVFYPVVLIYKNVSSLKVLVTSPHLDNSLNRFLGPSKEGLSQIGLNVAPNQEAP